MDSLCPKCRSIFSTPLKGRLASGSDAVPPETVALHSDIIHSLFESKSLPCHLCILLWEVRCDHFEVLLHGEAQELAREGQGPGKAEVRWRWEEAGPFAAWGLNCSNLPNSGRRLAFFIRHNLTKLDDTSKGTNVSNWHMKIGSWKRDDQNLVVFGFSKIQKWSVVKYNVDEISPSTNSEKSVQLMKSWISACKNPMFGHDFCTIWDVSRSNWNPTRLLYLGTSSDLSQARVFQPAPGSDPLDYLTLSHRWATQNLFTLTTSNIKELNQGIPLRRLSKTFRDAVDITRKLGIRYLWIDSLCIIQDSLQDWRSESARMGDVYKFAYCNLSATRASSGSYDGLYVDREPLSIKPLLLQDSAEAFKTIQALPGNEACYVHRGFEEWTEVTNAPLNKRGWVLQERIMSPRTLHFCHNQVVFECCGGQCSERWPEVTIPLVETDSYQHYPLKSAWAGLSAPSHLSYLTPMRFWESIMKHYPIMQLTRESDRLVALSGIARSLQTHLGGQTYVAGLWSTGLLFQLLWTCRDPATVRNGADTAGFVAPSWSWISARSPIEGYYLMTTEYEQKSTQTLVELLGYETTPIDDPLGQITDGFIKVQGRIAKGLLSPPLDISVLESHIRQNSGITLNLYKYSSAVATYFDTDEDLQPEDVYCLPLFGIPRSRLGETFLGTEYPGLLLLETGNKPGEFRRCGVFVSQGKGEVLEKALETTSDTAASSGIPYEKTDDGNEFVITIV